VNLYRWIAAGTCDPLLVLVMEPIVWGGGRFCPRILVGGARSVAAPQTLAGRGGFLLLSY